MISFGLNEWYSEGNQCLREFGSSLRLKGCLLAELASIGIQTQVLSKLLVRNHGRWNAYSSHKSRSHVCNPQVTYRHVVLSDEGRHLELVPRHHRVQVLDSRQIVNLRFDCRRHECREPPRHHLKISTLHVSD